MIRTRNFRVALIAILTATLFATPNAPAQNLTGIKCIVNGDKNASPDVAIDYRNGQVYVCCSSCGTVFTSDANAFTTKANHQLVLTGQYQQTKCPINGTDVDPTVTASVGGTKVAFCCQSCLKQVESTPDMADRAELVFGNNAFEKAFVPVESHPVVASKTKEVDLAKARCLLQPERTVSKEHSVDHLDGKVFFCCQKCADAFRQSPNKHAVAANEQLVATGQYVQTSCPLVGGEPGDEHTAVVAGLPIKFCCEKCVAAVNVAKSKQQKAELVFRPQRFAQAFKPASHRESQSKPMVDETPNQ